MKLSLKVKLRFALFFLFGMLVLVVAISHFALFKLTEKNKNLYISNYRSLEYVEQMREALDDADFQMFGNVLGQQQANVTELGEWEATNELYQLFRQYSAGRNDSLIHRGLQRQLSLIHALNREAIIKANDQIYNMTEDYNTLLAIIGTLSALIGFSFVLNFPSYISRPLERLKEGIQDIAAQNYNTRIQEHSHDEFGELTHAFNNMAERLAHWEQSNLASILRSKKKLEGIISLLPEGVIGLDEGRNILFINPVAAELLALEPKMIIGKMASEVALHNELLRELLKNNDGKLKLKIFFKGQESSFEATTQYILNDEGDQTGQLILIQHEPPKVGQ